MTLAGSLLKDIMTEAIADRTANLDRIICESYDDSTTTNVQAFSWKGLETRLHVCLYYEELMLYVSRPRSRDWERAFDLRDPTSLDQLRKLFCGYAAHKTSK